MARSMRHAFVCFLCVWQLTCFGARSKTHSSIAHPVTQQKNSAVKEHFVLPSSHMPLTLAPSTASLDVSLGMPTTVLTEESVRQWINSEDVTNAVAQIYVDRAELDFLEPYVSPRQSQPRGSAFLIREDGIFITNAHVVDQAVTDGIYLQMQRFGRRRFHARLLGVCPERDLAMVQMTPEDLAIFKAELGKVPVLTLGDSDDVKRADIIFTLGYPLQDQLKTTRGIVSGPQQIDGSYMIQIDAPINPGNSGGPSFNVRGQVVGVNTAGIFEKGAQNVGYIIPVNEVKLFLAQIDNAPLFNKVKVLRKPLLGDLRCETNEQVARYLGNPFPGGTYIAGVLPGSPLALAGIQKGDVLYEIDGYKIDNYGEIKVPWSNDRVFIDDYVGRLKIDAELSFVAYRKGKRLELKTSLALTKPPAIRVHYPAYEEIDYEMIGGFIVMELMLNHLPLLLKVAPRLSRFMEFENQQKPVLLVTHIFPSSAVARTRVIAPGDTLSEVNGKPVATLADFRNAIRTETGDFLTLKTEAGVFTVLSMNEVLAQEAILGRNFFYEPTAFVKELIQKRAHDKKTT